MVKTLLVASLFFSSTLGVSCLGNSSDLDEARSYLSEYSKNKFGNWFRYSKEFEPQESTILKGEFWIGYSGNRYRNIVEMSYLTRSGKKRTQKTRVYRSDLLFVYNESKLANRKPTISYVARNEIDDLPKDYGVLSVVLGYDPIGACFWYESIEKQKDKVEFTEDSDSINLLLDTDSSGRLDFAFKKKANGLQLTRVEITRDSGDLVRLPSGELCRLGEGRLANQIRFTQLLTNFEFKEDDPIIVRSVDVKQVSKDDKGNATTNTHRIIVHQIKPITKQLEKEISFPGIEIPNGTLVEMRNDEKIPYQYRDGRVVKQAGNLTEIADLQTEFEKPKGSSLGFYLVICGVGFIVAAIGFKLFVLDKKISS